MASRERQLFKRIDHAEPYAGEFAYALSEM